MPVLHLTASVDEHQEAKRGEPTCEPLKTAPGTFHTRTEPARPRRRCGHDCSLLGDSPSQLGAKATRSGERSAQHVAVHHSQPLADAEAAVSAGQTRHCSDSELSEVVVLWVKTWRSSRGVVGRASKTWRSPHPIAAVGSDVDASTRSWSCHATASTMAPVSIRRRLTTKRQSKPPSKTSHKT